MKRKQRNHQLNPPRNGCWNCYLDRDYSCSQCGPLAAPIQYGRQGGEATQYGRQGGEATQYGRQGGEDSNCRTLTPSPRPPPSSLTSLILPLGCFVGGVLLGALGANRQPPQPTHMTFIKNEKTVNNFYEPNNTAVLYNTAILCNHNTRYDNPSASYRTWTAQGPQSYTYPQPGYSNNLYLPCSSDHWSSQYEGNNTAVLYDPNARYDNPSPSYRTGTALRPQSYSSSNHRSSQYERNSTAIMNNHNAPNDNPSPSYAMENASQPQSYSYSQDGYSSDESEPDQGSCQYQHNSTAELYNRTSLYVNDLSPSYPTRNYGPRTTRTRDTM